VVRQCKRSVGLCLSLSAMQVQLEGSARSMWGDTAYETTLSLVTGRTHQVLGQASLLRSIGNSWSYLVCKIGHSVTGRTHQVLVVGRATTVWMAVPFCAPADRPLFSPPGQIRLQLAGVGAAVLGDSMYAGRPLGASAEGISGGGEQLDIIEPRGPIGLQAWRMEVTSDNEQLTLAPTSMVFDAGAPWWRRLD
jgi:hypothetical protein